MWCVVQDKTVFPASLDLLGGEEGALGLFGLGEGLESVGIADVVGDVSNNDEECDAGHKEADSKGHDAQLEDQEVGNPREESPKHHLLVGFGVACVWFAVGDETKNETKTPTKTSSLSLP